MRAVLCTSGGLPGTLVLQALRESAALQIAGVVLSTRILSPRFGFLRGAWEQYRRSGLRYSVYLGLSLLLRPAVRGIPVLATRDVNAEVGASFVRAVGAELIVSAYFNQKIGPALVALHPAGGVNIHPSLLPELKGVDPVFYARLRGSEAIGVTLHRLAPEFDAGNIVAQQRCTDRAGESVLATTARLYVRGARMLIESVDTIASGDPGAPQSAVGHYDSWPTRAQVAALRKKGVRLVTWRDLRKQQQVP